MSNIIDIPQTTISLKVERVGKKYAYHIRKEVDGEWERLIHKSSPTELTKKTSVGKKIYALLGTRGWDTGIEEVLIERKNKYFIELMQRLENSLEESDKINNLPVNKKPDIRDKYRNLYAKYKSKRDKYGYTDLQFIAQICQGLGVGISDIILKVYISYLLTVLKIKATNVIAIGSQSSGKSFSIESALRMIPQEYVIKGVHTEAYFFGKFNGMNLDRYIFYLGDLGGVKDDEKTIVTRDILKQLNTDGYIERGIAPESEPREEYVEGNPAIVYSTVEESIINEQEKSRSNIVKPPNISLIKLTIFNAFHDSPGKDIKTIEEINDDVESVQGLTWELMETIDGYEIFNPYMFSVTDFLQNMDDFNRKIKEFNKILLVVSILNNPYVLVHNYYHDEDYNPIDTRLIIASKQDVINALEIFDSSNNLLPTEFDFLKGLCNMCKPYPLDDVNLNQLSVREYEDIIIEELTDGETGKVYDWEDEAVEIDGVIYPCFFTVNSIRRNYGHFKWVKDVRKTLAKKLHKLYENNYLIKIGQTPNGENIYGLTYNIRDKIKNNIPMFRDSEIDRAIVEFDRKYPQLRDDFKIFLEYDKELPIKEVNYNTKYSELYNITWGFDDEL